MTYDDGDPSIPPDVQLDDPPMKDVPDGLSNRPDPAEETKTVEAPRPTELNRYDRQGLVMEVMRTHPHLSAANVVAEAKVIESYIKGE